MAAGTPVAAALPLEVDPGNAILAKSKPEHDEMRRLIDRLRQSHPEDAGYDDTFHQLMRDVMHHVADEEAELLPLAERRLGNRLSELGAAMTRRRLQLAGPHLGELAVYQARAMPGLAMLAAGGVVLLASMLFMARGSQPLQR